jgi:predicted Zn finger-like uncharacterized protein
MVRAECASCRLYSVFCILYSGFCILISVFCLSHMYTRCPSCHTVFHLHASQLTAARGQVRCGDCGEIFQSLDYLYDDPDRALAKLAPLKAGRAARAAAGKARPEPDAQRAADVPTNAQRRANVVPEAAGDEDLIAADVPTSDQTQAEAVPEPEEEEGVIAAPPPSEPQAADAVAQAEDDEPEQAGRDRADVEPVAEVSDTSGSGNEQPLPDSEPPELPRFEIPPDLILQPAAEPEPWSARRVAGWAAVLLLALGLVTQGIYASRETLATDPELAPWMVSFCKVFGCELPPTRDLADIQVLERVVRQHPQGKDALLVHTTLVNKAPFAQPYPILELRLADLSGGLVAGRRFRPSEYLPENIDIEAGMDPDVPVTAELELVRPDIEVVSYQFDFL